MKAAPAKPTKPLELEEAPLTWLIGVPVEVEVAVGLGAPVEETLAEGVGMVIKVLLEKVMT